MSKANFKKKTITSVLALLCAGAMLAGCDDVVARPTSDFYDEQIISAPDEITNNTMSKIYDAIVSEGDTNSAKVLNNILLIYSQSIYGSFYGEGNLYDVVTKGNAADLQAYADKYAIYEGNVKKVMAFYYAVVDKVEATFLTYVKNTSYQIRSVFFEKKFYDTQVKAFYKLGSIDEGDFKVKQVVGDIRLSNHTSGSVDPIDGVYFNDLFKTYENYIKDQILPDVYRTELVAQYLYSENYLAIGNSYARKVDYIKLTENSKHADAVSNLMEAYCKDVIASGLDMDVYGFPFLGNLYKGTTENFTVEQQTIADAIYDDANWTPSTYTYDDGVLGSRTRVVCDETTLGGYLSDYMKLVDSTNRESEKEVETIRNDFTNSGSYTALAGLHIKEQSLMATNETTSDWYTTGSLDGIPSDYSKRLFKGSIASNGVDHGVWNETSGKYDDTDLASISGTTYGAYVGNHYYLVSKNPQTGDAYPYILKDGSNFYLVMVDEAVNSSKISKTDEDHGYDFMKSHADDELYAGIYAESIARQVAYSMSTSETYKASSNQHWVEQMAITYHDTTVYDYFLATFPDLFD
ncbi:MAG: hypothetical protein LKK13_05470 [Bacilli bacterium]|jgi:hypothetical protein|nr:hypothetical protein [Bacilli bacterium]